MNKIFTTTSNGALPPYGESVLIFANGVVQDVTYMLDGADDSPDWFQPYHFGDDGDLYLSIEEVDGWCLIGDPINAYDANQDRIEELEEALAVIANSNALTIKERIDIGGNGITAYYAQMAGNALSGGRSETT